MSLKLDELRKRLLQQQSGSDGGAPEPSPSAGSSKIFGTFTPKAAEPAIAPKVPEPPAAIKVPEVSSVGKAAEPPVESKQLALVPTAVDAAPKPSEGDIAPAGGRVSSSGGEPEPQGAGFHFGAPSIASSDPMVQHELADAVGKVFEQTKAFQARLEDLSRIFEPIDRMGNSAARTFAPLRGFQKQMAQLARSFEPMRTFQQQLSQLAQNFEPMKALEGQLSQLADSFQSHIGELIKALEPAKQMRDRIEQLGAAFDQVTELQEQFTELYDAFHLSPPSNGSQINGLDAQSNAPR
jgi:methyl-accepting chemotaxis protein